MTYVFELTYPGTRLDYPELDWAWDVHLLLDQLESPIADAALALSLFEQALRELLASSGRHHRSVDAGRRLEIVEQRGLDPDHSSAALVGELLLETERVFRREQWRAGKLPESYRHRLPFIHARSYLFTMDRLKRLIGVLADMPRVPQQVADAPQALHRLLPDLRGIRNSVAHFEDRSRGLRRNGQPLDLKPVENRFISAPRGAIIVENLCDNLFGSTMADGSYGEVEVSEAALQQVVALVQQIIDAFEWTGPARLEPA
jgi:hypothetical protein